MLLSPFDVPLNYEVGVSFLPDREILCIWRTATRKMTFRDLSGEVYVHWTGAELSTVKGSDCTFALAHVYKYSVVAHRIAYVSSHVLSPI